MSPPLLDLAGQALQNDPTAGLEAVAELRQELDRIEELHVARAVHANWSWAQIGEALGVSKQAVHRKYAHRDLSEPEPVDAHDMLVSANARLAVFMARREAAARRDDEVGTEHLLLGMLQQGEGGACEALKQVGVTLQAARVQADLIFPSALADVEPSEMRLTRAVRDALKAATTEVLRLGDRNLETLHLLLALLRDPESRAVELIESLGVSPADVERAAES